MRVLVGCEYSGRVREAFRAKGHDAWSCDLLESEDGSPYHIQGDVLGILKDGWDVGIFHPPCTYLAVSGLHWNTRGVMVNGVPRSELTEKALDFVRSLMDAPIPRICIENPVSCISTRIRKPDQIIQPHWFGEDASKKTCLWLKNLPPLVPTDVHPGRYGCRCGHRFDVELGKYGCPNCCGDSGAAKVIYANQTIGGQNNLPPSDDRWKERSRTYPGIAQAFADQWAGVCVPAGGAGREEAGCKKQSSIFELLGEDCVPQRMDVRNEGVKQ